MKRFSVLVKQVLMSTLTAGIFTFSFSSCSDDLDSPNAGANDQQAPEGAKTELLEAYGLTYQNFISENDVMILDADTLQLSVSKAYADKMGITSFVDHPMGIWHKMSNLPYIRKATAQRLVGDRYILDVVPATIAEIVGDKDVNLQTDIYVNDDAGSVKTRAAGNDIPEYAAKYVDANNVVHPAAILMTDPYGYDKNIHYNDELPSASQTRAAQSGEYQYMTADELAEGKTRWGARHRLQNINADLNKDINFAAKGKKDSLTLGLEGKVGFELNYFITLEGGIKWSWCIPHPYVKKFETGMDGSFELESKVSLSFKKEFDLEDRLKCQLATFPGYTFTFFVGPVPIAINISPNMFVKMDGKVSGCITTGFSYEYGCKFKGGIGYYDGNWKGIGDFKETANEFKIIPARAEFELKTGVGLYLGADILIYGVAGPEFAVGPRLGGKLEAAFKPFEAPTKPEDLYEISGMINLTVNAVAGAKLKVLGYELAEHHVTIPLIGDEDGWVLFKYPFDPKTDKIHKSPAEQKMEDNANAWAEIKKLFVNKDNNRKYEEALNQYMEMNNVSHEEAEKRFASKVVRDIDVKKLNIKNLQNGKDIKTFRELDSNLSGSIFSISIQYSFYLKDKAVADIIDMLKDSPAYQTYAKNLPNWQRCFSNVFLYGKFEDKFGHEPNPASEQDMKEMLNMVLGYSQINFDHTKGPWAECYNYIMNRLNYERRYFRYTNYVKNRAITEAIMQSMKLEKKNAANKKDFDYICKKAEGFLSPVQAIKDAGVSINY